MKGVNPFTYVESLSSSKRHLMKGTENDDLAEKGYVPYLANRTLSYFLDTLGDANRMNMLSGLPSRLQYDFLFFNVRPRKRFSGKWGKPTKSADVEAIQSYFQCSFKKALDTLRILTPEELQKIHAALIQGGKP